MKMNDEALEELIYAVLRRCPYDNDRDAAKRIVDSIIQVEIEDFNDLTVVDDVS